nr:uncharacterized protein LOC131779695 [Pocillopora verrucosa]
MSSQDRKYFRFRFFRILVLLILFTSPTTSATNGLSVPEICPKLERALKPSQSDDELNKLLIKFLASVEWQQLSSFAKQNLRGLIKGIPPKIANSAKGSLVIVSVHLIFLSNNLYEQAVILTEDCKQHRDKFEELQTEMGVVQQAIKTKFSSLSKSIDFATMYERIEEVIKILDDFHRKLEEITNDVKKSLIKSQHNKPWAIWYIVAATAACSSSFYFTSLWVRGLTCVTSTGVIIQSFTSFFLLDKCSEELNQLQNETKKLRQDLAGNRTQLRLQLAWMKGPPVDIHIKSEGCEDPKRPKNTCGFANITVKRTDYSLHGRGYNVVVVDGTTGEVLESKTFDTHWNSTAGDHLKEYLNKLNGNKIVLVAIQDEGSNYVKSALDALKRLGATDPVLPDFRGSFALVGYAGVNKPSWIAQKTAKRGLGPSVISLKVPLLPQPH